MESRARLIKCSRLRWNLKFLVCIDHNAKAHKAVSDSGADKHNK